MYTPRSVRAARALSGAHLEDPGPTHSIQHNRLDSGVAVTLTDAPPFLDETGPADPATDGDLRRRLAAYQAPHRGRSLRQMATSFGGFVITCAIMYLFADLAWWLPLFLAPLAAGFLVRIFIIQHDCGHRAYFQSRRANDIVGFLCSLVTLAPYLSWRRQHAGHHGIWNDLDRRNTGADIYSSCLTVAEYVALSPWKRRWYRVSRHPIVANLLLPPVVFLLLYRLPFDMPLSWRRERRMVQLTNFSIAGLVLGVGLLAGYGSVVAVQLPVMVLASIFGVWLFSVQHRGPDTLWLRHEEWNGGKASLQGSNYLRLPKILQWFTGNIGFHHVHHLSPGVPNYRLQECHERFPALRRAPTISIWQSLRTLRYVLWDERRGRMVTCAAADG